MLLPQRSGGEDDDVYLGWILMIWLLFMRFCRITLLVFSVVFEEFLPGVQYFDNYFQL